MKAKFLMMAALSATMLTLGSCKDDPAKDFPESTFEIRQLRLDATNTNNGTTARSSENPVNGSVSINYLTIDPQGNVVCTDEGKAIATKVTFVKPTDAIIAIPGNEMTLDFIPGSKVNTATITFPDGTTETLNGESEESKSTKYVIGDFTDGDVIKGLHSLNQDGSIYNYTGAIYLWHYHPLNFNVSCAASGEEAHTLVYNSEQNAMVRTPMVENGEIVYDEDGYPVLVDETAMVAEPDQELTLTFNPAYPTDVLAVSLPDGTNLSFNAENRTQTWTVNQFSGSASIGLTLELRQANGVHMTFTGTITLNEPEKEEETPAE